jgi:hypothetical protein
MLNPIKRIWVPKKPAPAATEPAPATTPAQSAKPAGSSNPLFDELPSPDMEEKNSDSIWAAFESVHTPEIERK